MVKPLRFKGDEKKPKKRKRADAGEGAGQGDDAERQLKAAKAAKAAAADDAEADNDDSWVSAEAVADIAGPVMLVLPSEPPAALACDANGKVFALPVENMIDGDPSTAEPHDVRQVWVANRIVGTEHFRFKGHHGKCVFFFLLPFSRQTDRHRQSFCRADRTSHRYLSCDKIGLLSATAEAITPLESFNVIATADTPGTFQVQTLRDTFLTVRPPRTARAGAAPEVRGDETDITFYTTLRVRMQARFKPRAKAAREDKAKDRITRRELEEAAGRKLTDDEVKMLRRARREGNYHETLLDIKVKSKHDKFG